MEFPFWMPEMSPAMRSQRQRSRKACQPCRSRKRKCDGKLPCETCVRFEYDCYYSREIEQALGYAPPHLGNDIGTTSQGTNHRMPTSASHVPGGGRTWPAPSHTPHANLDPNTARYLNTNPAITFPKLLGFELNSAGIPRLHSFAYNLGIRPEIRSDGLDFTNYVTFTEANRLVDVFFAIVHPIMDCIDKETFNETWRSRLMLSSNKRKVDAIICGVLALGSLFAIGTQESSHPNEEHLVGIAKSELENTSTVSSPTYDHVTAWILRTIYLRATAKPHASWISSCTTMHLIEACGLQHEPSNTAIVSPAVPDHGITDIGRRRQLFWVAWAFNSLISHECGRSRVKVSGASVKSIKNSDCSADTITLVSLAEALAFDDDPRPAFDDMDSLQSWLNEINNIYTDSDVMILTKADLAFSSYRRSRSFRGSRMQMTPEATTLIIEIGLSALESVANLVSRKLPWWTIISVPFQLVCVLLAIDTRESLSHLSRAMESLAGVKREWNTHIVCEAVGCAGLLVKLSRRRKEEDLHYLSSSMSVAGAGPATEKFTATDQSAEVASSGTEPVASTQPHILPEELPGMGTGFALSEEGILPGQFHWADGADVEIPQSLNIDWSEFFDTINLL